VWTRVFSWFSSNYGPTIRTDDDHDDDDDDDDIITTRSHVHMYTRGERTAYTVFPIKSFNKSHECVSHVGMRAAATTTTTTRRVCQSVCVRVCGTADKGVRSRRRKKTKQTTTRPQREHLCAAQTGNYFIHIYVYIYTHIYVCIQYIF